MTARGFYTLFFGVLMMLTALSVGSAGAFLLGCAALCALSLSFLSVLIAFLTLRLEQTVDVHDVSRGEKCIYTLTLRMFSPLPVAPVSLVLCLPSGRQSEYLLKTRLLHPTYSTTGFSCPHVGVHSVGVTRLCVTDCFSFFSLSRRARAPLSPVTVLPAPIETQPLTFSPGEGEASAIERAQADPTTPTDTRLWQEGDELKRVHWKLSMRRQELMVHTYETPQRPDALVLLDLTPPPFEGVLRAQALDALTETCAGVMKSLLDSRRTARLPLSGDHPRELNGQEPQALAPVLHALAQESFSRPSDFARVLLQASRRMRRTGSTAVITASLTPKVADAILSLSRMGPRMRVYLIAPGDLTQEQSQLIHLLRSCSIAAEHVSIKNS